MSYKIVDCALMNQINKDYETNVPPSPSLTPSSLGMSTPERLTPDCLPDPWLLDTESLLSELGRVHASFKANLFLNQPSHTIGILGPNGMPNSSAFTSLKQTAKSSSNWILL
jgi:hypothetical protein